MLTDSKIKFFGLDINNPKTPKLLFKIVFLTWLISGLVIYLGFTLFQSDDYWASRGQFGDMFGAVNALFSGLAFAGIIYTILLQSEELAAQREELKLNREELQLTRREFQQQNLTLKLQTFETTFFNLLQSHRQMANQVTTRTLDGHTIEGTGCFKHLNIKIRTELDKLPDDAELSVQQNTYKDAIKSDAHSLTSYLFSLNTVLQFTERSTLPEDEKQLYYTIIGTSLIFSEIGYLYHHVDFSTSREDIVERIKNVLVNYAK